MPLTVPDAIFILITSLFPFLQRYDDVYKESVFKSIGRNAVLYMLYWLSSMLTYKDPSILIPVSLVIVAARDFLMCFFMNKESELHKNEKFMFLFMLGQSGLYVTTIFWIMYFIGN